MNIVVLQGQLVHLRRLFHHRRGQRGKIDSLGQLLPGEWADLVAVNLQIEIGAAESRQLERLLVQCLKEIGRLHREGDDGIIQINRHRQGLIELRPGDCIAGFQLRNTGLFGVSHVFHARINFHGGNQRRGMP